jgi:uncharacterized coiled-coil protein SlyX
VSPPPAAAAPALPRRPTRPLRAVPRPAAPPRRTPLEVVPPRRRQLRPGWVGVLAGGLLFVALFGLVAFQTVLIGGQARIDELNQQVSAQLDERQELSVAVADLRSPERVVSAAAERLGMIEPASVAFLRSAPADDGAAAIDPAATP